MGEGSDILRHEKQLLICLYTIWIWRTGRGVICISVVCVHSSRMDEIRIWRDVVLQNL